jgi:hypothetical protein
VIFLLVCFLALLTLAFVRLLGARATLSNRTFFAFLVLGALLGPASYQVTNRFFDPYASWSNAFERNVIVFFVCHLIILLPVFVYFFGRRVYTAASVADAFLLGFASGFGYDLVAMLFAGANTTQPLHQLTVIPPFTFDGGGFSMAGYGYWSAIGALTMAAGLRFLRNRYVAFTISALVILFFACEQAALIQPAETNGHWFGLITVRGLLTPYLALVALVVCSFLEYQWMNRLVPSASQRKLQVLGEWQALLNALVARKFHEFRQLGARMRLERNSEIARAELAAHADDPALKAELAYLDNRLAALPGSPSSTVLDLGRVIRMKGSTRQSVIQLLVTVFFVGVCFLMPMLPDPVAKQFWDFQLFHFPLPGLGVTVLNTLLMALILWRYLSSPAWPSKQYDPDELLDFSSESSILKISVALALVAILYGPLEELYNFSGAAASYVGIFLAGMNRLQLTTSVMLLCAWATGLSLHRQATWKAAALPLRRASAIHNALTVLSASTVIWAALVFFAQMQSWAHVKYGAWLFNHFAAAGNSVGDFFAAALTAAFTYAIVSVVMVASDRAQAFLAGPPPRVQSMSDAAGAGR